jgi:hypothetical protein
MQLSVIAIKQRYVSSANIEAAVAADDTAVYYCHLTALL